MASTSKDLLDCTGEKPSSLIESILSSKSGSSSQSKHQGGVTARTKPSMTALPTSQVIGKVKDFLGVMAKANEKLQQDAQENTCSKYDIEVLDGTEQEFVSMELLLGITDLHTDEAVAAAEASLSSFQPSKSFSDSGGTSSSSETEYNSEDDDDDGDGEDGTNLCEKEELPKSNSKESLTKNRPNKRPKIVVLN